MSKSYEHEGENNKKYRQNITIFSISERRILAYRYFINISVEESHYSESELYYPKPKEERAKTEQINMSKVYTTHGDENFGNSRGITKVCSRTEK